MVALKMKAKTHLTNSHSTIIMRLFSITCAQDICIGMLAHNIAVQQASGVSSVLWYTYFC